MEPVRQFGRRVGHAQLDEKLGPGGSDQTAELADGGTTSMGDCDGLN